MKFDEPLAEPPLPSLTETAAFPLNPFVNVTGPTFGPVAVFPATFHE
jgi:hypothetical protein